MLTCVFEICGLSPTLALRTFNTSSCVQRLKTKTKALKVPAVPQCQTGSVSRLVGADSIATHKSYFAFHKSQHHEFPPEHLYISMFIKNKQINTTTTTTAEAPTTTTTATLTKGFNGALFSFQRGVVLLLEFRVVSRNIVHRQKSKIKITRNSKEPKCLT